MFKGVLGLGFVSSYTLYCGNNNDQPSPHLYFHSKIIQRGDDCFLAPSGMLAFCHELNALLQPEKNRRPNNLLNLSWD